MKLQTHWISNRIIEVKIEDEVSSGLLNKDEAIELAEHLINVASELLSVEKSK